MIATTAYHSYAHTKETNEVVHHYQWQRRSFTKNHNITACYTFIVMVFRLFCIVKDGPMPHWCFMATVAFILNLPFSFNKRTHTHTHTHTHLTTHTYNYVMAFPVLQLS